MVSDLSYEALLSPPRPGSWGALYWGSLARVSRAVSPLSEGMSIGYRHGFDSGSMLDYVYRNQAHGKFGIGRLLDRCYLDSIGWRGIRQRRVHLKRLLSAAIERQRSGGARAVHVADIAAGPGRYLLEVFNETAAAGHSATLRDRDEAGLSEGRALAKAMGVTNVRYERGDAFDPEDIGRISPRPQIAIVSGLYELFADNTLIQRSLGGLRDGLAPNGELIYTNQPAHPQLELIARCLPNREGRPWVMRLRSQDEMDGLVRDAGFERRETLADRWGIFTVSRAIRV